MGTALDREPSWTFAVGAGYRTGGSVDFEPQNLVRPGGGPFVNGRHQDSQNFLIEGSLENPGGDPSPQLSPLGWEETDPDGDPDTTADNNGDEVYTRNVTFDQSNLDALSADVDGSLALSLEAQRHFSRTWLGFSSLTLGIGLTSMKAEASASQGNDINTTTWTGILSQNGGAKPSTSWPLTPYQEENGAIRQGGPNFNMTENLFLWGTRTTSVGVDLTAEALQLTLRAGLQREFNLASWWSVFIGAGPTLNIAMIETELEQTAVWDAPGNSMDGEMVPRFADTETESDVAVLGGVFGMIGTRIQLMEHLATDFGCRYNKVFGTAETDHAELDLGHIFEAELRLVLDF